MIKETLIYSDYEIITRKNSQIDSNKIIYYSDGLLCPKCKTKIEDEIKHGISLKHNCGLKMTRYGNSLECELK